MREVSQIADDSIFASDVRDEVLYYTAELLSTIYYATMETDIIHYIRRLGYTV